MRKCDWCKNESVCSGVQRSECIVRDYLRFEMDRSPADEEIVITRLLIEAGGVFNPGAVAKHLVKNGIVMQDDRQTYTAFVYEEDGVTSSNLSTYDDKEDAVSFAESHNWDEVVDDISGEVVWHK